MIMPFLNYDTIYQSERKFLFNKNQILVACLCAKWCDVCNKYEKLFYKISFYYKEYYFIWIDIDSYFEYLDIFKVENFPTVILEDTIGVRFNGQILPNQIVLKSLISKINDLPIINNIPSLRNLLNK